MRWFAKTIYSQRVEFFTLDNPWIEHIVNQLAECTSILQSLGLTKRARTNEIKSESLGSLSFRRGRNVVDSAVS